jgi:hypothetical protein
MVSAVNKFIDICTEDKYIPFSFILGVVFLVVYCLNILPGYSRWIITISLILLISFVFNLCRIFYRQHKIDKYMKNLASDNNYFNILCRLYKADGSPVDFDNRNIYISTLQNAGMIELKSYLPVEWHSGFDSVGHEYSGYTISYLGKKYLKQELLNRKR